MCPVQDKSFEIGVRGRHCGHGLLNCRLLVLHTQAAPHRDVSLSLPTPGSNSSLTLNPDLGGAWGVMGGLEQGKSALPGPLPGLEQQRLLEVGSYCSQRYQRCNHLGLQVLVGLTITHIYTPEVLFCTLSFPICTFFFLKEKILILNLVLLTERLIS